MTQTVNGKPLSNSSSSGQTDQLKLPKDVLELGKVIVKDLGLDPGVDTLGRWMAHHLAELMADAEQSTDPEQRRTKEKEAAEAIIKLWQHRHSYDNRINPFQELKPILQVLRSLDPNRNVWIAHFG